MSTAETLKSKRRIFVRICEKISCRNRRGGLFTLRKEEVLRKHDS